MSKKSEGLIDRSASDFGVICREGALSMAFHGSAVSGCCCRMSGHVEASPLSATADGPSHDAERIGREVAAKLIEAGGDALLEEEQAEG
jgi:hypothetical protein